MPNQIYSELQRIILRELYEGRYMGGHNFHSMSAMLSAPSIRGKFTSQQFQVDAGALVAEGLIRTQAQANDLQIDMPTYAAYLEIEKRLRKSHALWRYLVDHITLAVVLAFLFSVISDVIGNHIYTILSR